MLQGEQAKQESYPGRMLGGAATGAMVGGAVLPWLSHQVSERIPATTLAKNPRLLAAFEALTSKPVIGAGLGLAAGAGVGALLAHRAKKHREELTAQAARGMKPR